MGQSVGAHLVLGSTLKLVHALGRDRADLDVGAMASVRPDPPRRDGQEPEGADVLDRRQSVRAVAAGAGGVALGRQPGRRTVAEITVAIDADLTTTPTAAGDERHLATGVEAWLVNRRVGLRGGVGMNTDRRIRGDRRSVGVSVGLRAGLYLDGAADSAGPIRRGMVGVLP